ncbi:FtsX-like permease family protein [Maribacter sp. MJ134]|uniref:ABC transporter permease n=1 Tax=Maribacter sp. MJ134 TaxID=2496865 RepID=UPI000F84AE74|nr:ABC transporter permease [Maribacter sp. MJ134]AZQ60181.1 FtsX-like permease family protein [Maribacter sp. MJ134]
MLIKYALRNIRKRPVLNSIKIVGLSLGSCGVLFIVLFIKSELSYDLAHTRTERTYRFTTTNPGILKGNHFARFTDAKSVPQLMEQLPEIEDHVRLMPLRDRLILKDEQHYAIDQAFAVDDTFFRIFNIDFKEGNKETALKEIGGAVISRSLAQKVFGDENPMGKIISLPPGHYNSIKTTFTVTGVMEDFVKESHLHPDLLVMPGEDAMNGWTYVYLLLKDKASAVGLDGKLSTKLNEIYGIAETEAEKYKAHITNIKEIHLKSNLLREIEPNGNMTNIWLLSIAALILLFISLSNFTSLNIGMAGYLTKFLALQKILGSSKRVMSRYFLLESALIIFLSLLIVSVISFRLNSMVLERYQIDLFQGNEWFVLGVVVVFSLLGIIAGMQPAFKQRFQNASLGTRIKADGALGTHKVLLIAQFGLAMFLLVGVIVISRQTNYALDNSMAAKEDNVVCIPYVHSEVQKDFGLFKNQLLKQSAVASVSAMMAPPGGETNDMFSFEMQNVPNKEAEYIGVFSCDNSFADVFGLSFLGGKNFNQNSVDQDGNGEYLINKTALSYLGYQDANAIIGEDFALISPVEGVTMPKGKIIGVVEDFHLSGLQTKVEPLVLFKRENSWLENIVISYEPTARAEAVASIKTTWNELFPKYPLTYYQVSSLYKEVYKTERLQKNLILIFALTAVFICAMGVLGLSLMVAQRRVKEIGIRKVNGATISEILVMLNTDFLKWLLLAFVLATPIAYFAASKWLEVFAYKIDIEIGMFLLAGGTVMAITIFTVSWHSYKAARVNPVTSLRTE